MADEQNLHEVTPAGSTAGTIPLMDLSTQAVVHMPYDDAAGLIKSGKYALPKGFKLPVQAPDGTPGTVDASEASDALNSGYSLDTLQDQKDRQLQKDYGSPLQTAAAGLAGAARGLSFGLSDQALTKTGLVEPQTLAGLEDANPWASGLGTAAGIGAGLLTGAEEAGAAAKGAQIGGKGLGIGSGVEGVSAVGKAAENFIGKQAAKAGLKNSVAKSILENIVPKGAGSLVEGAFYGAGNLLSEEALGRADFNAESLAANIGTGALLGGAFGGAFATGAELVDPAKKVLGVVGAPFGKNVSNQLDKEVATARLFGQTPTQYAKFAERNPKIASEMNEFLVKDLKLNMGDTAESLNNKIISLRETSGKVIGDALDELDTALVNRPDLRPTAAAVYGNIAKEVEEKVLNQFKDVGVLGASSTITKIQNFVDEATLLSKSGRDFRASDLQRLKKAEDKLIKYNASPGKWSEVDEMLHVTRSAVKTEIDNLANSLEQQGLSSNVAERLKEANRQYAASTSLGQYLETRALKAGDKGFHWINTVTDAATDATRKLVVLGKIEGAKQAAVKAINRAADAAVGAGKAVQKLDTPILSNALMTTDLSRDFTDGKQKRAKTREEAYQNILANVTKFQQNPENLLNHVTRQTSAISGTAPNTAAQLDTVALNALNFLSTKIPKGASMPSMLDIYKKAKQPSTIEMAKFERYVQAIMEPTSVMKHIEQGLVTREETDALKAVYPSMFEGLRNAVMDRLPAAAATMPYNKRVQLGLLFDVPADQSMQGQNVMGLQANFSDSGDQGADSGAVNTTQAGLKDIGSANRLQSGTEAISDDDGE